MNQLPPNFQNKCLKQKIYCTKQWYFLVLYCPTPIFAPACCLHHTFPETAEVGLQQSPVCVIAKFTRVMSLASPLQRHCQGWLAFLRGRWRTLSKPPMKMPILVLYRIKYFSCIVSFYISGINLLLTKTFKRMSCDHRDSPVRVLRQILGCLVRISLC